MNQVCGTDRQKKEKKFIHSVLLYSGCNATDTKRMLDSNQNKSFNQWVSLGDSLSDNYTMYYGCDECN